MASIHELGLNSGDTAVLTIAQMRTAGKFGDSVGKCSLDMKGAEVTVAVVGIEKVDDSSAHFKIFAVHSDDPKSEYKVGTKRSVNANYPGFLKGIGYGDEELEKQLEKANIEVIRIREAENTYVVRRLPALRPEEV